MFLQIEVIPKDEPSITHYLNPHAVAKNAKAWSLGRKAPADCLVRSDKTISREHLQLHFLDTTTDDDASPPTITITNTGKLGTFLVQEAAESDAKEATAEDVDSDATPDEQQVSQQQHGISQATAEVEVSDAARLRWKNTHKKNGPDLKAIELNETITLEKLEDEQILQCGRVDTTVILSWKGVTLSASGNPAKQATDKLDLTRIGSQVVENVLQADYVVTAKLSVCTKQLTAYCRGIPLVLPSFVQALVERTHIADPWPDPTAHAPKTDSNTFWEQPHNRNLWRSCTLVCTDPEAAVEQLVQAAGVDQVLSIDTVLNGNAQAAPHMFAVGSSSKKIKQLKKEHPTIPTVTAKQIAQAITEQRLLQDNKKNTIGIPYVEPAVAPEEEEEPTPPRETRGSKRKTPEKKGEKPIETDDNNKTRSRRNRKTPEKKNAAETSDDKKEPTPQQTTRVSRTKSATQPWQEDAPDDDNNSNTAKAPPKSPPEAKPTPSRETRHSKRKAPEKEAPRESKKKKEEAPQQSTRASRSDEDDNKKSRSQPPVATKEPKPSSQQAKAVTQSQPATTTRGGGSQLASQRVWEQDSSDEDKAPPVEKNSFTAAPKRKSPRRKRWDDDSSSEDERPETALFRPAKKKNIEPKKTTSPRKKDIEMEDPPNAEMEDASPPSPAAEPMDVDASQEENKDPPKRPRKVLQQPSKGWLTKLPKGKLRSKEEIMELTGAEEWVGPAATQVMKSLEKTTTTTTAVTPPNSSGPNFKAFRKNVVPPRYNGPSIILHSVGALRDVIESDDKEEAATAAIEAQQRRNDELFGEVRQSTQRRGRRR